MLSCIPDGLRVGDLAAKHVWPKAEDIANVPKIGDLVLVSKVFGSCTLESFKYKFPSISLHTFFFHTILDDSAYYYLTKDKCKPGRGRNISYVHTCFNCSCEGTVRGESTVSCAVCNVI